VDDARVWDEILRLRKRSHEIVDQAALDRLEQARLELRVSSLESFRTEFEPAIEDLVHGDRVEAAVKQHVRSQGPVIQIGWFGKMFGYAAIAAAIGSFILQLFH
jgi:hypothetical protein